MAELAARKHNQGYSIYGVGVTSTYVSMNVYWGGFGYVTVSLKKHEAENA